MPGRRRGLDLVAIAGLATGAILGIAGTVVSSAPLRQLFWGIDGVALIVAATLLAIKFFRQGNDSVAAGFLVFAKSSGASRCCRSQPRYRSLPTRCSC